MISKSQKQIICKICCNFSRCIDSLYAADQHYWKNLEEGKLLPGKFCDYEEKIKKYIRKSAIMGRNLAQIECREMNIFSRPASVSVWYDEIKSSELTR